MASGTSTVKPPPLPRREENCADDSEDTEDDLTVSDHVRVIVRCRPLKHDSEEDSSTTLSVDSSQNRIEVVNPNAPSKVYHFCCVADAVKDQNFVFQRTGKPIVECALAGFNGAIVAYGQTGSGKTFTMQGAALTVARGDAQSNGIIQSVCETIFAHIHDVGSSKDVVKFSITASYLEIYNETLIDLLSSFDAPGKQVRSPSGSQTSSTSQTKLTIREDSKGNISVVGLSQFEVDSPERCYLLLKAGAERRTVGATKMNMESSRSHAVFTLTITKRSIDKGIIRTSRLHLVDLAGSERQKGTGATGIRLREAGEINKSLSALGNVINALSARESSTPSKGIGLSARVPSCRDSKLTFLLKDSLGGNAKLCLIATISPALSSIEETLSTLEFAKRCAAVRNEAVVNESLTEDVTALQREVRRLQKSLKHMQMSLSQAKAAEAELRVTCHSVTGERNFKGNQLASHETNVARKDAATQVELMEAPQLCEQVDMIETKEVIDAINAEHCPTVDKQHSRPEHKKSPENDQKERSTNTESEIMDGKGNDRVQLDGENLEEAEYKPQDTQEGKTNENDKNGKPKAESETKLSVDEMQTKWKEMIETNHRLWDALTVREKELTELREGSAYSKVDGANRRLRQELELMRVRAENNPEMLILKHRIEAYEGTFKNVPSSPVTPSGEICAEKVQANEGDEDTKGIVVKDVILKATSSKRLACSGSIGDSDWMRSGHSITRRLRSGSSKHGSPTKSVSFVDGVKPSSSASSLTSKCRMIQAAVKTANEERMSRNRNVVAGREKDDFERRCDGKGVGAEQGLRRTVTRRMEHVSLKDRETPPVKGSERKQVSKTSSVAEDSSSKKKLQKRGETSNSFSESKQADLVLKGKGKERECSSPKKNEDQSLRTRGECSDKKHFDENENGRKEFATDDSWIRSRIKAVSDDKNEKKATTEKTAETGGKSGYEAKVSLVAAIPDHSWMKKDSQAAGSNNRRDGRVKDSLYSEFGGGLSVLIDDLEKSVAESEEL